MHAYLMGVSARRRLHVPVLVAVLAAVSWLPASARADSPPEFTSQPAIQGSAVVGSTLTAVATWTGDPTPTATYAWGRCPADGNICPAISGATGPTYAATAADVGSRLAVRIDLDNGVEDPIFANSAATPVVVAPPAPAPAPVPAPPAPAPATVTFTGAGAGAGGARSEEHTSELQSRI